MHKTHLVAIACPARLLSVQVTPITYVWVPTAAASEIPEPPPSFAAFDVGRERGTRLARVLRRFCAGFAPVFFCSFPLYFWLIPDSVAGSAVPEWALISRD